MPPHTTSVEVQNTSFHVSRGAKCPLTEGNTWNVPKTPSHTHTTVTTVIVTTFISQLESLKKIVGTILVRIVCFITISQVKHLRLHIPLKVWLEYCKASNMSRISEPVGNHTGRNSSRLLRYDGYCKGACSAELPESSGLAPIARLATL